MFVCGGINLLFSAIAQPHKLIDVGEDAMFSRLGIQYIFEYNNREASDVPKAYVVRQKHCAFVA